MASFRTRLTAAYTAAVALAMTAFALGLYGARRSTLYTDLGTRVDQQTDSAMAVITALERGGEPVTVLRDSVPAVSPALRTQLEGIPDYMLVLDADGRTLYASYAVRQLDADDFASLSAAALRLPTNGTASLLRLSRERLLLIARTEQDPTTAIDRVVVGKSTASAELAPRELIETMLLIAPIVLVLAIGGGYYLATRAVAPVERIIDEVEAITDGRSLHRRVQVSETADEVGRLVGTINAMIARLETSFGALRRFTADASHELKTPLTVLRADVERAMTAPAGTNDQLVALEEALQETARMADLVDSLLTLARADEGRFDLHREPVHLEPLVREVFETAVILGGDAGINVSLPVLEDATVMGDPVRLRQLFLNLITNAIKYTPQGGRVDVSLSRRLDSVTFSVRDTGIGISAADLPYIFERFWRADRVRSRKLTSDTAFSERGGFGLGLAICQWIAQAHGGSLTVTSRLGRGSTFVVSLPLPAEPVADAAHEHDASRDF